MTPSGARLAVRGLACRRGERILFRGLDLDVAPGEIVWLRAPNGFGKTTLLRVLAGLSKPEAGTIAGIDASCRPLYLAHANALKDDLTVAESVRHAVRLFGLDAGDAAIDDAIARVGLASRRDAAVRTMSQGQRRRVALARLCLSSAATTWLLDEPFDALDANGVETAAALVAEHAARGGAILLTSHLPPPLADLREIALDAVVARVSAKVR